MQKNNNQKETFIQKYKNALVTLLALVIIIGLVIVIPKGDKSPTEVVEETPSEQTEVLGETTPEVQAPAGLAAYEGAISAHEGKVISVADACVATPDTISIALGETALIVNNGEAPQVFTVGDDTFTVGARHYKTLRFKEAQTASIVCGEESVATVVVA